MSSASFKKAQKAFRRSHKERSQPASRERLGLLEKHKDYVLRAKDFSSKAKRIKQLKEKAAFRNPDEFYHKMISTKTKNGVHIAERNNNFSGDMWKLMASQDLTYAKRKLMEEKKKVDRLESNLHLLVDRSDDERPLNQHTIFLDSKKDVAKFDPAEHFNTDPSLVHRTYNRLTKDQLHSTNLQAHVPTKRATKARESAYRELEARKERLQKLSEATEEMQTRKVMMTKGIRKKVATDSNGNAVFKWKKERKR
eukprot:comp71982_c0_seq1/m.48161 comp71982_c0_seq1/g.48161  ORF comp71982_c0_seq1/g.48161 comp71982_c0_seq1/m.48161 type:complete len:253 (-) comp71982_c0_seq1:22-780(-)